MYDLTLMILISFPVIWAISEEIYNIHKYGKNHSGFIYRNELFRLGYVFTPIPLLFYLLSINNIIIFILLFIGWLMLIKTMAIPEKFEYNYNDDLKSILLYILIIILLLLLLYIV